MKTTVESNIFTQLIATAGALILINQNGIIDGWSSPNLARLTSTNSTISLTKSEVSWLASSLKLGRLASVILLPIFLELAGTRKAILYAFVPVTVAWIIMMIATSAVYLYIARLLSGITYGLACGCLSMYLGEIAESTYRGTFTAIALIGWPSGALVATLGETYLPRVASSALYFLLCLLGMTVFIWLPESPYQLVKNKDQVGARRSLAWFRGHNDTDAEMTEICEFVEASGRVTFWERVNNLRSASVWKAVLVVSLAFIYPQLCGIFNVIYYMQTILTDSQFHLVDAGQMVIYVNVILLVASIVTINLLDKVGRRVVLIIAIAIATIALIGLSLHYYLLTNNIKVDPTILQWLPIASIIVLLVTFSVGYGPTINALLSEMFPSDFKSFAATIVSLGTASIGFASTKAYQPLIDAIGEAYLFMLYAVIMATLIPVVALLLPETKGRSLQSIQNVLNKI